MSDDANISPKTDQAGMSAHRTEREFELKFSTDSAGLRRVLALELFAGMPPSRAQRQKTTYFDTETGRLLQNSISLRLRQMPRNRNVITLKAPHPDRPSGFERLELEIPVGDAGFNASMSDAAIQDQIRPYTQDAPLVARYGTDVRRRIINIQHGRSQLEVALDSGSFIVGDQAYPLHEVEIELRSGDRAEAIEFAKSIALQANLTLETISKAQRCALFAGLSVPVRRQTGGELQPDHSLDSVISIILSECLQHFIDHIHPFRNERSPASIHQMRVGLRRLRAALKIFAKSFPESSFRDFAGGARILASGLGDARECDVFYHLAFDEALSHPSRPDDFIHLKEGLLILRDDARQRATALIESPETLTFILDMQAYLFRHGWRSEVPDAHFLMMAGSAAKFARNSLDNLLRQARKRGKNLTKRSDEERHEFRIALKNLRYNADFFSTLFGGTKVTKAWFADLRQLQDLLGLQNDLANAQTMIERIKAFAPGDFSTSAGFVIGWQACNSQAADRRIGKSWRRLKRQTPFWH